MKTKTNIFLFIGGIFLVIFTWSFIVPQVKQILNDKSSLDQETARLEKIKRKLNELKTINQNDLSERTNLALQAVPPEKNFLGLLSNLEKAANKNSLAVESFQVIPGSLNVTQQGKLSLKMSIIGSLENVKNFLVSAESILPIVDMKVIKIGIEKDIATTEMSLDLSFLPLPKTLGSIDSPLPHLTVDEEKALSKLSGFDRSQNDLGGSDIPAGKDNPFTF